MPSTRELPEEFVASRFTYELLPFAFLSPALLNWEVLCLLHPTPTPLLHYPCGAQEPRITQIDSTRRFSVHVEITKQPLKVSINREWRHNSVSLLSSFVRHELDHDTESGLWLLIYWDVGAESEEFQRRTSTLGSCQV